MTERAALRPWALATTAVSVVVAATYGVSALAHAGLAGSSDLGSHLTTPLTLLVVATWLVGAAWLKRAMAAARAVDADAQWARSDWTAFTAWVIPVVFLFAPYVVVRDVCRVAGLRRPSWSLLLWVWWATFAVTAVGLRTVALATSAHVGHALGAVYLACDVVACAGWALIVSTASSALAAAANGDPVRTSPSRTAPSP